MVRIDQRIAAGPGVGQWKLVTGQHYNPNRNKGKKDLLSGLLSDTAIQLVKNFLKLMSVRVIQDRLTLEAEAVTGEQVAQAAALPDCDPSAASRSALIVGTAAER